jgi:hypothetical protein
VNDGLGPRPFTTPSSNIDIRTGTGGPALIPDLSSDGRERPHPISDLSSAGSGRCAGGAGGCLRVELLRSGAGAHQRHRIKKVVIEQEFTYKTISIFLAEMLSNPGTFEKMQIQCIFLELSRIEPVRDLVRIKG